MDQELISRLYKQFVKAGMLATTDSRNCPKDAIFFALKGETFNGNQFAGQALEKGCAIAVIDEPKYAIEGDSRFVIVDDVLKTYKLMAREHRRQFDIPVIGITGTNGKTTTKELIATVLAEKYNVLFTQGNFNNDIGVPKTLLQIRKEHQIAVIEMGASHPGDIKTLVETAEPTCGLITNVGKAHLQGFGSFEGVKRTKGELYDFLKEHHAPTFINHDNKHLLEMQRNRKIEKVIYYGQTPNEELQIQGETEGKEELLHFTWRSKLSNKDHQVATHMIGNYNLDNMLAAITIGSYFGVKADKINQAIENYIPSNNRSQLTITDRNRLIVDAYNANPTSMTAAINNFNAIQAENKMAILGDMKELGEAAEEEHRKIVELLNRMPWKEIWLVGEEFGRIKSNFRKFHDAQEVKLELEKQRPRGFNILIKGSNSMHLAQLTDLL